MEGDSMTERIYLTEPNCTEFKADIKNTFPNTKQIVLNRSAFYPEGGGQPSDHGTLDISGEIYNVVKVSKIGKEIFHTLDKNPHECNDAVLGKIDTNRRNLHTRMHTALHILNGIVFTQFNGALVTGGQINSDGTGRMDFILHGVQNDQIRPLEAIVNNIVDENREVRISTMSYDEAMATSGMQRTADRSIPIESDDMVRIVEIVGLDKQACGGTHTKTTGEVGRIRFMKIKNKGKENRRIKISLDGVNNQQK